MRAPSPWEHWVIQARPTMARCRTVSCWCTRRAARIPEEHSETPYMTRRAVVSSLSRKRTGGLGACICPILSRTGPILRLSPTPACGAADILPAVRSEKDVRKRIRFSPPTWTCATPATWRARGARSIPTYGPDQADRRPDGRADTVPRKPRPARHHMIVFTSDHGDYLGDHWMGEKDLFTTSP